MTLVCLIEPGDPQNATSTIAEVARKTGEAVFFADSSQYTKEPIMTHPQETFAPASHYEAPDDGSDVEPPDEEMISVPVRLFEFLQDAAEELTGFFDVEDTSFRPDYHAVVRKRIGELLEAHEEARIWMKEHNK